jgi:hypothetical protein
MKIFETLDDNIVLIDGVKYQRMVNETPKPITLELIIVECMIGYNNTVIPELIENILDRVQVEWLPDEYQSYSGYNEGWNDCLETIKGNIKQNGEKND